MINHTKKVFISLDDTYRGKWTKTSKWGFIVDYFKSWNKKWIHAFDIDNVLP